MTPPESPTNTPVSGPYNGPAQPVEWPWKLFFTFLGLFAITSRGHTGSIDEESLLYASSRIVHDALGMLGIAWSMPDPPLLGMRLFTTYEPGQPLLATPFYVAGSLVASVFPLESHTYVTRLVATFFGAVVTAATIARLYQCGRVLGQGSAAATFMAATYGMGTLAWPYARTLFREPLTGFALLSAAYALVRLHERPGWRPAIISWGWVLLAVMTKLAAVFTVPIFALYFAGGYLQRWRSASGAGESITWTRVRSSSWRSSGVIAAAVTVLIVVLAALVFQNRWKQLGPYLSQTGLFTGDFSYVPVAFYGLTLSPGKGLLVFAPPVLAGLAGLYLLYRQRRAEALLFAALFAVFLGVYSFNTSWHGGASWGPRYLLPVLPFLLAPLGTLAQWLWTHRHGTRGQVGLALVGVLVSAGVLVQVGAISVDPVDYYLRAFERRPLTMEGGPAFLQEIHFDPALSPITGHLALGLEYAGNLASGRNHFEQVPFDREAYLQYFRDARSLDFTIVHLYEWSRASR